MVENLWASKGQRGPRKYLEMIEEKNASHFN